MIKEILLPYLKKRKIETSRLSQESVSLNGRAWVWAQSPPSRKRIQEVKTLDLGESRPGKGRVPPTIGVWLWVLRAEGSLPVPLGSRVYWRDACANMGAHTQRMLGCSWCRSQIPWPFPLWGKKRLRDICTYVPQPTLLKLESAHDPVKMQSQTQVAWVGPEILNF